MATNDILTLSISAAALLLSGGTFLYERMRVARLSHRKELRKCQLAFLLGADLMKRWMLLISVDRDSEGAQEGIDSIWRETKLSTQGLADHLNLGTNVVEFLQFYDEGEGIADAMERGPLIPIEERVDVIHGEKVRAAFDLGMLLDGLAWITITKKEEVAAVYSEILPSVKADLKLLHLEHLEKSLEVFDPSVPPDLSHVTTIHKQISAYFRSQLKGYATLDQQE
jgi:hypothetical protein